MGTYRQKPSQTAHGHAPQAVSAEPPLPDHQPQPQQRIEECRVKQQVHQAGQLSDQPPRPPQQVIYDPQFNSHQNRREEVPELRSDRQFHQLNNLAKKPPAAVSS